MGAGSAVGHTSMRHAMQHTAGHATHTRTHARTPAPACTHASTHASTPLQPRARPARHRSARFAVQLDNVGFNGDFEAGFGACSYTNYQAREWNTPSINAYPLGGMTSLTDAMRASAEVCCAS